MRRRRPSSFAGAAAEDDASEAVVHHVQYPEEERKGAAPGRFICVLPDILTRDECDAFIARSEGAGFTQAQINVYGQQRTNESVRNNDRAIIDDPSFAEDLWQRIRARASSDERLMTHLLFAPWVKIGRTSSSGGDGDGDSPWECVGLNERLRVLRYDPGTYFAPHFDGNYVRTSQNWRWKGADERMDRKGETSHVTCMLYLNDGFEGGATRFFGRDDDCAEEEGNVADVVPVAGSVLLFEHHVLHEGCLLTDGRKYALRTDVMYTKRLGGEATFAYSKCPIPMLVNPAETEATVTAESERPGGKKGRLSFVR
jgi:hypothetical protein